MTNGGGGTVLRGDKGGANCLEAPWATGKGEEKTAGNNEKSTDGRLEEDNFRAEAVVDREREEDNPSQKCGLLPKEVSIAGRAQKTD